MYKRQIQAASGKAHRITVIMPLLYGSRQHRRTYRESLDCAYALQELQSMGVSNIITFDAHEMCIRDRIKKSLDGVKVLGNGEITKALTVQLAAYTATAKEKIEKAGGKAEVI